MKTIYTSFEIGTSFWGWLTKLHQTYKVEYFITSFEKLEIYIEDMTNSFFKQCFISGLKEEIQEQV